MTDCGNKIEWVKKTKCEIKDIIDGLVDLGVTEIKICTIGSGLGVAEMKIIKLKDTNEIYRYTNTNKRTTTI